jgi:outer membrane protein assembly factor BamB
MGGYDFRTGKEIWKLSGAGDIPVPTPVVSDGMVYLTSAHGPLSPIFGIRLTATGDISLKEDALSNESIAWSIKRGGNYMTTPIVYKGLLYCCSDRGALSCFDAKTGKLHYRETLKKRGGAFSASPVAADGKLYFSGERGDIHVVKAGPEFESLAENDMEETCMATPAISEGVIFFRTRAQLVAVGETK